MKSTVLITGGLGYVGGRIAREMVARDGLAVRIGTSRPGASLPSCLDGALLTPLDLFDDASLDAACTGVDCIVHLAALNENDSVANPSQALLVNGLGTLKLLQSAERDGVSRFIYFSTAHVYGAPLEGIITEQTLPRPVHPYAITHRIAEDFVLAAHDKKTLTGIVVRLSNGFGAPHVSTVNRWTLLVNDLCHQAVTTGELVLKSHGLQRRDFIPLSDVARAVIHLQDLPVTQIGDGLYNLGGEAPLQIVQMTELIADRCEAVLGHRPTIIRPPASPGDHDIPLDYRIDKLKQTGFALTGALADEIDATLRLCRNAFESRP